MKVQLLVTLKVDSGQLYPAGSTFDDEKGDLPDFISRRIGDMKYSHQISVIDPIWKKDKVQAQDELAKAASSKGDSPISPENSPEPDSKPKPVKKKAVDAKKAEFLAKMKKKDE